MDRAAHGEVDNARQVRRLVILAVLSHSAFAGARVAVSLTALHARMPTWQLGLALSLFSALPMLASVAAGRVVDRIGVERPMRLGMLAIITGLLVAAIVFRPGALFVVSVLAGVGFMSMHLSVQTLVGEIGVDADRRENFSLLALGFSVSGFLGPTSAGLMIDAFGHRIAMALLALPALAAFWLLLRWPISLAGAGRPGVPRPAESAAPPAAPRTRDLLREPQMRRVYLAVALSSAAWDVHQFLVPIYGTGLGYGAAEVGLVLGIFSVATFIVRSALPAISRRVPEWRIVEAALLMAAAIYALYPFSGTLPMMLVLSFVLGLGLGAAQPMLMALLHRSAPSGRIAESTGLRLTMVNTTQTILPTAFGALGAVVGLPPLFWGLAVVVGIGGAWVIHDHPAGEGQQG